MGPAQGNVSSIEKQGPQWVFSTQYSLVSTQFHEVALPCYNMAYHEGKGESEATTIIPVPSKLEEETSKHVQDVAIRLVI